MTGKRKTGRAAARWAKRIAGILFLVGVVALLVVAWMPKPVPTEIVTATRGDLLVTVDEDGQTRVKDRYVVSVPLAGNVARIELDPGDRIQRGDVLARLVPVAPPMLDERSRRSAEAQVDAAAAARRQALAQIERAKSSVTFAEKELARQKALVEKGVGTQAALDQAALNAQTQKAELASARFGASVAAHQLEMAQAVLGRVARSGKVDDEQMIVVSPIDGMVLKVMQESEGVVQAGVPLLELGDPAALEIVVDLLTSDAIRVKPGARVFIEEWGGNPLQGRVRLVEPSAFTRISSLGVEEQRVNTVIELTSPRARWGQLGDGYRVETRVVVWEGAGIVSVPASAVFRQDDGWAIFAVDGKVARLRRVKVGQRNSLQVEIVEGLTEGERVVSHPSDRVQDGVEVTVR